jgi:hypothetical protein
MPASPALITYRLKELPMISINFSRAMRLSLLGVAAGASMLLTGCVVAPLGPPGVVYHGGGPVYAEPSAVVVVPGGPRGYYGHGYRGRPHGGYYGDRGYRGGRADNDGGR